MGVRYSTAGFSFWRTLPRATAPFCCVSGCPFWCDMLFGLWRADIADAAEGPDVAELTDWGRAVDIPAIGSDLEGCHIPRVVRFREPQSPPLVCGVDEAETTVEAEEVEEVEVEEAREFMDEEEFVRCAVLRGRSILDTSSAFMAFRPLFAA